MWYSRCEKIDDGRIGEELEEALRGLPERRREYALSFRFDIDRLTCAKAYLMLKSMLSEHYGIDGDVEFGYGQSGKPFLKSYPGIHFNISHCKKAVMCAVGDQPLGVDVEEIQFDDELAKSVFSESEYGQIISSKAPEIVFTELWTRKEGYLKLMGTGLVDNMKSLQINAGVRFDTKVDAQNGYISTVAVIL